MPQLAWRTLMLEILSGRRPDDDRQTDKLGLIGSVGHRTGNRAVIVWPRLEFPSNEGCVLLVMRAAGPLHVAVPINLLHGHG